MWPLSYGVVAAKSVAGCGGVVVLITKNIRSPRLGLVHLRDGGKVSRYSSTSLGTVKGGVCQPLGGALATLSGTGAW